MRCFPIFPSVCHRQRGEEGGANASRHSRLMYIHTNRDGRSRWSRTFMHAEAGCVFSPPRSRSCPSRGGHTPPLCCYTSYFVILLVSFVTHFVEKRYDIRKPDDNGTRRLSCFESGGVGIDRPRSRNVVGSLQGRVAELACWQCRVAHH